jgi:hypothetical protein
MRTLCDACESAAAIVFCAADEAALCRSCDEKVLFFLALSVGSTSPNYLFLILVNLLGLVFLVLPLILAGFLLRLLVKPITSYFWMLPI